MEEKMHLAFFIILFNRKQTEGIHEKSEASIQPYKFENG
jgi:hypothetical protein